MSTKKRLLRAFSFKANFRCTNTSWKLFSVCLVSVDSVNVSSSNRFWLVYYNYISSPTVSSTVIKVEPNRTDKILVTDVFCHQHRLLQIYFTNISSGKRNSARANLGPKSLLRHTSLTSTQGIILHAELNIQCRSPHLGPELLLLYIDGPYIRVSTLSEFQALYNWSSEIAKCSILGHSIGISFYGTIFQSHHIWYIPVIK